MQPGDGDQPAVENLGGHLTTLGVQPSQIGAVGDLGRIGIGRTTRPDECFGREQRHLRVIGDEQRLLRWRFGNAPGPELQPDLVDVVELDEPPEGIAERTPEQCGADRFLRRQSRHMNQYPVAERADCAGTRTPPDIRAARIAMDDLPPC